MTLMSHVSSDNAPQWDVLRPALGYLAAITAAELLTTFWQPQFGLLFHGVLLVVLLVHVTFRWEKASRDVLLSLSFAPLIRLMSLSLPLVGIPLVYWYFITSVPLFVSVLITARRLHFSPSELGLNLRNLHLQVPVIFLGLGFGYMEYYILRPKPLAAAFTWEAIWLPALILLVSTGFAEEVIFRGLMQQAATPVLGWTSHIYVSAIFAVLHVGYRSLTDVLFVFGVAMVFAMIVRRTGSIVGVSLAHGLTNIVLFLVAPFVH